VFIELLPAYLQREILEIHQLYPSVTQLSSVNLSICHFACTHDAHTVFYSTIIQILLITVDELFELLFYSICKHILQKLIL
jgi:hypothetical protein